MEGILGIWRGLWLFCGK